MFNTTVECWVAYKAKNGKNSALSWNCFFRETNFTKFREIDFTKKMKVLSKMHVFGFYSPLCLLIVRT